MAFVFHVHDHLRAVPLDSTRSPESSRAPQRSWLSGMSSSAVKERIRGSPNPLWLSKRLRHGSTCANGVFGPPVYRDVILFDANGSGVGFERVVVGEPTVHCNRRSSVKLREKRKLLQLVSEAVRPGNRRNIRGGKRVAHFKIPLASSHLTRVPPSGSRIIAERVIHPLTDFMSGNRSVVNGRNEQSGGFEVNKGIGLQACSRLLGNRGMESENAAALKVIGRAARHYCVVEQKDGKLRRAYTFGG